MLRVIWCPITTTTSYTPEQLSLPEGKNISFILQTFYILILFNKNTFSEKPPKADLPMNVSMCIHIFKMILKLYLSNVTKLFLAVFMLLQ